MLTGTTPTYSDARIDVVYSVHLVVRETSQEAALAYGQPSKTYIVFEGIEAIKEKKGKEIIVPQELSPLGLELECELPDGGAPGVLYGAHFVFPVTAISRNRRHDGYTYQLPIINFTTFLPGGLETQISEAQRAMVERLRQLDLEVKRPSLVFTRLLAEEVLFDKS